jgi:alpha-L-fucosidase
MRHPTVAAVLFLLGTTMAAAATPPAPYGPVPSPRQLAWHARHAYAFVHFTVNTFTDREWGLGDESPDVFAPTDFSADQIVAAAQAAGLSGVVLTCTHHDGFCLWPSAYTEHSVKFSKWKDGHGDVVREISDACHRHGLAFGVYLSPWDRNSAAYGTPAYLTYYRNQLTELLTHYGPVFEVWLDGANGGDGYYGGAREKRTIDNTTYYDWPTTIALIRKLQPEAAIFSDAGPDARWGGNERGIAGDPCWSTLNPAGLFPGHAPSAQLNHGDRPGTAWLPAEMDVSIRPGWFYHAAQDAKVKTPAELTHIYYESVGRGTNLILNLAPDRRGRLPDTDVSHLLAWRQGLDRTFATNLADAATITADHVRGNDPTFAAANLRSTTADRYFSTDDDQHTAEVQLTWPAPVTFDVVRLSEVLSLGQRVDRVAVDAWIDGAWHTVADVTSIGAQRLVPLPHAVTMDKVRVRVVSAVACPALYNLGLFQTPAGS